MKTKISKKFKRIQTLAVILTLSFTGIPVSPVWAGDSTALTGQKETVQPVKSVTPVKRVPAALPKASADPFDLVPPGPLSKAAVTKAPTNLKAPVTTTGKTIVPQVAIKAPSMRNLKGEAKTAPVTTSPIGLYVKIFLTSALHLEFLKQVSTMGELSKNGESRDFYDKDDKAVATVEYHKPNSNKIKTIKYALVDPNNPDYKVSFSYKTNGEFDTCAGPDPETCYTITLSEMVITEPGPPWKLFPPFHNTQAAFTKFLNMFYTRTDIPRPPSGRQMTRYNNYDGDLVAMVNTTVNPYGEQESTTISLPATSEVFTYGSNKELTNYEDNKSISADFPIPTPETTPKFTVPDFVWEEKAKTHLAYLEKAYTQSPKSTKTKKFFLNAAGGVAATVYSKGTEIKKIAYADPYYTYLYNFNGGDFYDGCGFDDSAPCTAPPTPEPTTTGGITTGLVYENTLANHTKFLDKFYQNDHYQKFTILRTKKNHQVTVYKQKDWDRELVAWVDVELDEFSGKLKSATATTWDIRWDTGGLLRKPTLNRIYTYGLDGKLSGYTSDNLEASRIPPDPKPQSTTTITVPDSIVTDRNKHYTYLNQAYGRGSFSSDKKSKTFKDAEGKLAATVYYESSQIKAIVYADSAFAYFYDSNGYFSDKDPNNPGDKGTTSDPPMTPTFSTNDTTKLNATTLTGPLFYRDVDSHMSFLKANYDEKLTPLDSKTTEYRYKDSTGNFVAIAVVKRDDKGKRESATVTTPPFPDVGSAVFTYATLNKTKLMLTDYRWVIDA